MHHYASHVSYNSNLTCKIYNMCTSIFPSGCQIRVERCNIFDKQRMPSIFSDIVVIVVRIQWLITSQVIISSKQLKVPTDRSLPVLHHHGRIVRASISLFSTSASASDTIPSLSTCNHKKHHHHNHPRLRKHGCRYSNRSIAISQSLLAVHVVRLMHVLILIASLQGGEVMARLEA